MAGQLMLINPKARTGRTAAQKAATKRLVALNKARKGRKTVARKTAATSAIKRMKRRAKNPIGGKIAGMFMSPIVGGLGAVVVNTLQHQVTQRFVKDPAIRDNKAVKYGSRVALAVALGMFGGRIVGNARAKQAAEGALIVAAHDVVVETVNGFLSTAKVKSNALAAYEEDYPALQDQAGMSAYSEPGLGAFAESGEAYYTE